MAEKHHSSHASSDRARSISTEAEAARVIEHRGGSGTHGDTQAWPTFPIVGIGASAGGLDALQEFFRHIPQNTPAAYVVVMHLSPETKSVLPQLLSRRADITMVTAENDTEVKPGHGYVIPEDMDLTLNGLKMHLEPQRREQSRGPRLPIDLFFQSMASHFGPQSTAVVLSGSGSDGSRGMREVALAGGMCFVQDPQTAQFDGMPRAAINIGLQDAILRPSEIARVITRIHSVDPIDPRAIAEAKSDVDGDQLHDAFDEILHEIDRRTHTDLSYYKESTLSRRIARRMKLRHESDPVAYLQLLRQEKDEVFALKKDILIGVTSFFRDPEVFQSLSENVIPELVSSGAQSTPIRVWVPACSTGEEAYSLAILIDEEIKRQKSTRELTVFATDIDEEAIEMAGRGVFTSSIAADITRQRLSHYFTAEDDSYIVNSSLRKKIVFAKHDMLRDAPLTRMDLVSCRNFLIYLEGEMQEDAAALLYYALKPGGYLLLGQAETPSKLERGVKEIDRPAKIYRKSEEVPLHQLRPSSKNNRTPHLSNLLRSRKARRKPKQPESSLAYDTLDAAAEAAGMIVLLLESDRHIRRVFGNASDVVRTPRGEVGTDVHTLLPPPLAVAITGGIQRLRQGDGEPRATRIRSDSGQLYNLRIRPLGDSYDPRYEQLLIALIEPSQPAVVNDGKRDEQQASPASQDIINALELELQQTRTDLHATIEELATSNEEQQSTNEELIASNEELQSTNEELQSVNEELQTVNSEHQAKILELTSLYSDLDNLLRSTEIGTLFLDGDMRLRRFTPTVAEMLDISQHDMGRKVEPFLHPLGQNDLIELCEQVYAKHEPAHAETQFDDGSWKLMRITPYDSAEDGITGVVVSFFDVTPMKKVQQELLDAKDELEYKVRERTSELSLAKKRLDLALTASDVGVWTYDPETQDQEWDDTTYRIFGRDKEDGPMSVEELIDRVHADDRQRVSDAMRHAIQTGEPYDVEYRITDKYDRVRVINARGRLEVHGEEDCAAKMVGIAIDITNLRRGEEAMVDRDRYADLNRELEQKNKALDEFVYTVSHDLKAPIVTCKGFLEVLEKQVAKGQADDAERSMKYMRDAVQRMDVSIQRLLELSRIGRARSPLSWVDTQAVLDDVLQDLDGTIRKLECQIDVRRPLPNVYAEKELVRRVLANLISNACKYGCPEKGMPVRIYAEETDEAVELSVQDEGAGIDPKSHDRVFELFTRLSDKKGPDGTGVGLVIVKRAAELVGGECGIDSEVGKGARFWISFPKPSQAK